MKTLSPGVLDLVNFFQKNNFSFFEKMLWGSGAIFLRLLGSHRGKKNKSMKEFVRFSTTDVFVPVSQLSTRDLFNFLENLKIKQDMFLSWISRQVRSVEQRALWFPYSRLFFGIVFKRVLFLEYLGFLQSQLWCPFWIFDTSLSERCLNCWLVKKNDFWVSGVMLWIDLKSIDMAEGFYFLLRCLKRKVPLKLDAM